ncbi:MAG TPA: hypothetical protein VGP33_15405 [Chloroflexota bacterium]|nr:hypothetical protein [Chloroflexota bacterium]
MSEQIGPAEKALRLYAALLRLYPRAHRQAFGAQMLRTFRDQYDDASKHAGGAGPGFWLAVIGDEMTNIVKEQAVAVQTRRTLTVPRLVLAVTLVAVVSVLLMPVVSVRLAGAIPVVVLVVVYLAAKKSTLARPSALESAEHVWLRHGLTYGLLFGAVWSAFNLANTLAAYHSSLSVASTNVGPLLLTPGMPIICGLVGFVSARRSHRARDGAFAGLLSATVSSLLVAASLVIALILFWSTVRYNAFQDTTMISDWQLSGDRTFDQFLWGDNLRGMGFITLFSLIFGGLFGTLGGMLGAVSHRYNGGTGVLVPPR